MSHVNSPPVACQTVMQRMVRRRFMAHRIAARPLAGKRRDPASRRCPDARDHDLVAPAALGPEQGMVRLPEQVLGPRLRVLPTGLEARDPGRDRDPQADPGVSTGQQDRRSRHEGAHVLGQRGGGGFGSLGQDGQELLSSDPGDKAMGRNRPFKPGRDLGKNGVVRDPALHASAVHGVTTAAWAGGWGTRALAPSPLPGPAGNVEYFLHLRADSTDPLHGDALAAAVDRAVEEGPP